MFNINLFKKRQQLMEKPRQEQYLPPDLEGFRVQPPEPSILEVPERERKFRAFTREMENPSDMGIGFEERTGNMPSTRSAPENKLNDNDRLDMILQKLETIDLRLKLIEQKLERRPI